MAKSLGAKGTRNYQHRAGKNTSVRSNQMSRHQTPARSAAVVTTKNGDRMGSTVVRGNQIRTGLVLTNRKGSSGFAQGFRAPASMPRRLNNTAAAAVAVKQTRSTSAIVIGTIPGWGQAIGAAGLVGAARTNKKNNYATLRLKAAGYKVGGTGLASTVKPASAKTQAKARAKLKAKTSGKPSGNRVGTKAKGTPPKSGGRRNFRPRRDSKGRWAGSY